MPAQKQANQRLRKLCEQSASQATFVDTFTPLLGPDGQPDPTLFLEDNLHLNEKGYARWKVVLEPLLK
jgi:lysophospholipase L1-like esterase